VIYEPTYDEAEFFNSKVLKSLDEFKTISDVIVSNRLNDELDEISKEERLFLGSSSKTFKVRKVILFGDDAPIVFAKSVIPTLTIDKGLSSLGKIGNAPLGDILFTPSVFIKLEMVCASFLSEERNVYWGRKIKYSVNSEPISVMEVFLI